MLPAATFIFMPSSFVSPFDYDDATPCAARAHYAPFTPHSYAARDILMRALRAVYIAEPDVARVSDMRAPNARTHMFATC